MWSPNDSILNEILLEKVLANCIIRLSRKYINSDAYAGLRVCRLRTFLCSGFGNILGYFGVRIVW